MSLREEVAAESASTKRACIVCTIRASMTTSEQAEFDDVILDESLAGATIARVLQRRGYPIHQDGKQIRAHRARCVA